MFVSGPPDDHEELPYFDCVSNQAAPATDALFGGTYAIALALIAANDGVDEGDAGGVAAVAGVSALFLGSMAYGFARTSACSDAKAALGDRILDERIATRRKLAELQAQLDAQTQFQVQPAPPAAAPAPAPVSAPDPNAAPAAAPVPQPEAAPAPPASTAPTLPTAP